MTKLPILGQYGGTAFTPHAEAQALVDRLTAERDAALADAKRLREALVEVADMDSREAGYSAGTVARAALKGQP